MVGKTFGRLKVLRCVGSNRHYSRIWECLCECGNTTQVITQFLNSGHTKSCGCYQKEKVSTHGMTKSRIYKIYRGMWARCNDKNSTNYHRYGGRGIKMCDRWMEFTNFYEDMFPSYVERYSIERINNDGNYEPENCKWIPLSDQGKNTSMCKFYTIDGVTKNIAGWAKEYNIHDATFRGRIKRGWDIKECITKPVMEFKTK